jgi:hypothetical protein
MYTNVPQSQHTIIVAELNPLIFLNGNSASLDLVPEVYSKLTYEIIRTPNKARLRVNEYTLYFVTSDVLKRVSMKGHIAGSTCESLFLAMTKFHGQHITIGTIT